MSRSQPSSSTATERFRHVSRRSAADIWNTANFQAQVVNRLAPRYVSSLPRIITVASFAACSPSTSRSATRCAGIDARRRAASRRAARTRNACSSATARSRVVPSDRRRSSQALDSGSGPSRPIAPADGRSGRSASSEATTTGCHASGTSPLGTATGDPPHAILPRQLARWWSTRRAQSRHGSGSCGASSSRGARSSLP